MGRISTHKVVIIDHSGKGGVDAQGGATLKLTYIVLTCHKSQIVYTWRKLSDHDHT